MAADLHDRDTSLSGLVLPSNLGTLLILGIAVLLVILSSEAYRINFPRVEGIPEVPSALPFVGHLHHLGGRAGKNDATIFTRFGRKLRSSVFQIVLGSKRAIVVNDWDTMRDLWVGHANDLIDRPHQPGFVDKLGIDLTGSPMKDVIRKCRADGMRALGRYYHLPEPSSGKFIHSLHQQSRDGQVPIDTYAFLRHIVFDLSLSLTYGARFGEVDDAFMVTFKSINDILGGLVLDQVVSPLCALLRLIPERTSQTIDCIAAALDGDKRTEDEVHGTCLSLLQAAPDTVASGVYMAMAWLSSPAGRETQELAVRAILDVYGGDRDRAWKMAFCEERVLLIGCLTKETLRFFTFAPYATPRRRRARFGIEGDHNPGRSGDDAWEFRSDRFVGGAEQELPHVAFGAGSRICPAVAISDRIICALLTRMILAFDMTASDDEDRPVHFSDVYDALVAHPRLYDCHFLARDPVWLDEVLAEELAVG